LRDLTGKRHFKNRDHCPSEKDLREMFEVSRTTIRGGLQSLVAFGLIKPRSDKWPFVTKPFARGLGQGPGGHPTRMWRLVDSRSQFAIWEMSALT